MPQNDPSVTVSQAALDVAQSPDETKSVPDPSTTANRPGVPNVVEQVLNRYILGEEIARGGMGEVYRATDTVLNREVAVKVLQSRYKLTPLACQRFTEEARITGQLQHPNIPAVHDLGMLPDGRPFLAMKLIKGETLDRLLKDRDPNEHDLKRFLPVFEQICQAIAYAHAHGVIHRDLKPANVMVGAFGETQVMDWGLAKVLSLRSEAGSDPESTSAETEIKSLRDNDDQLTQAGSVLGTPAYMPPEQAVGAVDLIDARSDVFGLGAVLAVVLTGQPPFVSDSGESTRLKSALGDLSECFATLERCGADAELVSLCKRCLSPKREDRPIDAGLVAEAVAKHRADASERARLAELEQVEATERRKRRRVQRLLATVAVGLLAAVGLAALVGSLWQTAERARGEAVQSRDDAETARERLARVEYGRTMQVAYQEYRENNVAAARALLENTRADLRGWEYHHVHRLCHAELLTLKGSGWKPEVSPDGKRILTTDLGNTTKLYETESGKELLVIPDVQNATLSPDGMRIAVIDQAGIRILDAYTGTVLRTISASIKEGYFLEFSPDANG